MTIDKFNSTTDVQTTDQQFAATLRVAGLLGATLARGRVRSTLSLKGVGME
jgi:hypothetical protein